MSVSNPADASLINAFASGYASEPEAAAQSDILPMPSAESRRFARGLVIALSISVPFWCVLGYGVVLLLR